MTRSNLYRSFLLSVGVLALLSGRLVVADEPATTASTDGPLLIASKPEKPKANEEKKYELRYKLKRGDVLRYEVTSRASFNTTIEQTTQAAQTKTLTVKSWKVTDILPNSNIEFISVVDRVYMINQLPEHDAVEYDSAVVKTPPAGFEDIAKTIGVPLIEITMTPHGKIERRDWKIRGLTADDNSPIALRLPDEPVAIGDTWDEPFDVQVGLENGTSKQIQTRRHHELKNVSNDIATIEVTYQVLSPIDPFVEYQLVQRLMTGEVRFDIPTGRVVSQQFDIDKRILGFAGPTSSTHYLMRMEEKLLKKDAKVTAAPTTRKNVATKANSKSKTKTASRPRKQRQGTKTYRR
jgi:hypothetical protein